MRRWLANALAFTLVWLFVRGVPATPTRLAEEAVIGAAVSLPLAYAVRGLYGEGKLLRSLRALPYAVLYVLAFLKELLVANVTVARLTLSPSMPIDPAVVEVPLRVETDAAVTTIANSITLTPGTLTMDYDAETNCLYVHSISGGDILDPIRTWEDYALAIFRERLKPGDPVPAPETDPAAVADRAGRDTDGGGDGTGDGGDADDADKGGENGG